MMGAGRPLRLAALLSAVLVACAQPRQPPGGEPDRTPPRVVAVSPAPFATITDLSQPVVIRFDERLSERLEGVRELHEAVLVSPATGAVRARRGRREVEISIEGGWQPGLVYRVEVLPVFRDLFNNVRTESIELVFSTGAPIQETAVAGFVEDRLTGLPAPGARVEAARRIDATTYVARTDTAGFFAMRYLPAGAYDITAWLDRNRDRVVDFAEPQDSGTLALGYQDTVVVEMRLLPGDTTPARLVRAVPLDSLIIELGFDDYFPVGPVPGSARVFRLDDSTLVAEGTLLHRTRLDSIRAAERAEADALRLAEEAEVAEVAEDAAAAERPATDTLPPVDAAAPARPGGRPPRDGPAQQQRRPLPARELILVLPWPLQPETAYDVDVTGVVNIRGVPGGGGTARFRMPARPPAPPRVPADTVPPPPPDTLRPPPDTAATSPVEGGAA